MSYSRVVHGWWLEYPRTQSDALCDADKLAALVTERRWRRGKASECEVTEVRWRESRHCAHLVDKRDKYLAALTTFLSQGGGVKRPSGRDD